MPFTFSYEAAKTNKGLENSSVDDPDPEYGVKSSDCPYVVHGLLGANIIGKTLKKLKSLALDNLSNTHRILGIGHAQTPKSIFRNPTLYPQMFLWLFPYGLGRIQNTSITNAMSTRFQKANCLMYYNKRFQLDQMFPIVELDHEQIQASCTGSYLLTKKSCYKRATENIMSIDSSTLDDLISRLEEGERVSPCTREEKKCFDVLHILDHIT